jgi:hypothetical protein
MIRTSLLIPIAAALVGLGWTAAKAQSSEPNFEIVVNAPAGETSIQCVRGCNLAWVERGLNPNNQPIPTFTFKCTSHAADARCSSAKVGGWITGK